MSDVTGGLNREVEVSMFFGKSEVKVTAIEGISKKKYEAFMKFESQTLEYNGPPAPQVPTKSYHMYVFIVSFLFIACLFCSTLFLLDELLVFS